MRTRALVLTIATGAALALAVPALAAEPPTGEPVVAEPATGGPVTVEPAAVAGPVAVGANPESVSQNWAGYEARSRVGTGFSSVSGGWVQPSVSCTAGAPASYSAYWVGLGGGGGSTALEQEGTQADCGADGTASYHAWYELVPAAPVRLDLKVSAGDQIWAKTTVSGDQVTLQVDDRTTGQSYSNTLTMNVAPETSTAEWVAEAPSQCAGSLSNCSVLPLANFGTVQFTDAYATAGGHTGAIGDSNWTATPIALASGGEPAATAAAGSTGAATPSSLSADGTGFSVDYGSAAAISADGYGSGGYGGYGGYGYGGYGYGGYGSGGYGGYGYGYDGYGGPFGQLGIYLS